MEKLIKQIELEMATQQMLADEFKFDNEIQANHNNNMFLMRKAIYILKGGESLW